MRMSRYIDIEPYEKDGWYLQKRYHNSYGEVIKTTPLVSVPTAEVEPVKHGRWIREDKVYPELPNDGDYYWYCSECRSQDQHNINVEVPFCWHCGARMLDEGEDE